MKILYAIQGTGNGHVCRAEDVVPALMNHGEVDVLISGTQADIELPFPIQYRFTGLSFIFGKKGGVDLIETYKKSRLKRLYREIKCLPVEEYDLVISDFEPVSSWACYLKNIPCIALSHQAAVADKSSPRPSTVDPVGKAILKGYAPASIRYGFHFQSYADHIFTPIIRQTVRTTIITNAGHYTVYLPAYSDKRIVNVLRRCRDTRWQVFSKHNKKELREGNVEIFPLSANKFIQSLAASEGVLCGAGFETPAEAIFLKKKLMVIPMKKQFEQHCNAAALSELGVPVLKSLRKKHIEHLESWISDGRVIEMDYPDITGKIIERIISEHGTMPG